jgi:hypothetical protein
VLVSVAGVAAGVLSEVVVVVVTLSDILVHPFATKSLLASAIHMSQ